MNRLTVSLILLVAILLAFVVGVAVQAPGLIMAYLCLAPWIGIAVGRASIHIPNFRPAILDEHEVAVIEQLRGKRR